MLRKLAARSALDVLVVVDRRDVDRISRKWTMQVQLIDVVRGEMIFATKKIHSSRVEAARNDPLVMDPLTANLRQLRDYLHEELSMEDLPEKLRTEHVLRRIEMLSGQELSNPLPMLSEVRFYREQEFLDDAQLLTAYQSMLGSGVGAQLLLGSADAKRNLFKPWLPADPLIDRTALIQPDDDDDE